MNKHITSPINILLMVLLVGVFLTACGASQPPATASTGSQSATTTLDGQALLKERCTVCHNLNRVTSAHKTADQWTTTVERMVGKGAQLNAQEKQTLIDYLAQTYP
jgi:mono/diheme cytochrome c family protein